VSQTVPREVDLFVIGAGSGGVRAARIAAGYGAKVAVAEEYRVGGTCVIRGCVPKKLLVYASRFAHEFEDAAGFGWTVPQPTFDWATLIANKDKEIDRLERAYVTNLEKAGVVIARTRAVLADPHTVRLASGETVRAARVLIATGGAPAVARFPGHEYVISSNEAFHLPALPPRVLIHGGGYIALEFAGIFSGLGSAVTVVCRNVEILRGFDEDVRKHLRAEMERRGITIVSDETIPAVVEKEAGGYLVHLASGKLIEADCVMFATGRHPNVTGVGLQAAGVKLAETGGIAVDGYSRTSVPHIYAVGDVTNRINLTPVAIREGHAFADTVFGKKPTAVDHANVPSAVFSEPEVGVVGLTETQARERHARIDIYKATFRPMKATLSGRDTRMLMKLVVDGASDCVLGCHIVGEGAAEMVQMAAIAVKMKATKADFDATMALHPTAAEELVTMRTPTARYGLAAAE